MASSYGARVVETIERGGTLSVCTRIAIFRREGEREEQIGEYLRNHPWREGTFFAFRRNGKDYALYSPFYTATRILALPACQDLGGEEHDAGGFCPVEYFVPAPEQPADAPPVDHFPFGFVGGCYWAREYHIQYLDLTQAPAGRLIRDRRAGYIPWLNNRRVEHHVSLGAYEAGAPVISVLTATHFNPTTGEQTAGDDFEDPQPYELPKR